MLNASLQYYIRFLILLLLLCFFCYAWEQVQRATKSICHVARSLGCGGSPKAFDAPNDEENSKRDD